MIYILIIVLFGLYPFLLYPYFFKTIKKTVHISELPNDLEDITILHISDTHFYGFSNKIILYLKSLWGKKYDLIIVTGDIIDENIGIEEISKAFSGFKARYGKFYILGNHDLYFYDERYTFSDAGASDLMLNTPYLVSKMKKVGFRLLNNESFIIKIKNTDINIAGCSDLKSGQFDLERTFKQLDLKKFTIFLSHNPDVIKYEKVKNCDMVFSGHTHGGQIILPFIGALVKKSKHVKSKKMSGIFKFGKMILAISNGVGSGRVHKIRFLCNPQCIIYKLKGIK